MFGSSKKKENVIALGAAAPAAAPGPDPSDGAAGGMAAFRRILDCLPVNLMTVEPKDLTIGYVNRAGLDSLRTLEHLLPCKAADLQGQHVEIFYPSPEHRGRLLAEPGSLPHEDRIRLGDRTLALRISAVTDDHGAWLGPVLTWSVLTDRVAVAETFEAGVKGVVETVSAS